MRKAMVILSSLFLCFSLFKVGGVFAQDGESAPAEITSNVVEQQGASDTEWKQQFSEDRAQIQAQKEEIKNNMIASRDEEQQLRQQIGAALQANDLQTADKLKEALRAMHQENMQGMQQDRQNMQADRQALKNDLQEARQAGVLPLRGDNDNNPPGPRGGAGTNWENKPGPQGGEGTSPDFRPRVDRDNNPPGPRGGAGTNWENKPGPQGGAGTSPNRGPRIDRDNNPPGPRGGAGTNWENKPGPRGGAGASPNRRPQGAAGGGANRRGRN